MLGTEESLFLSVSQSGRGEHYLSDGIQSVVQFGRGGLKLLGCSRVFSGLWYQKQPGKARFGSNTNFHKARSIMKCMEEFGVEKLVWLAQNFVLNPIDYHWRVLMKTICQVFTTNIIV